MKKVELIKSNLLKITFHGLGFIMHLNLVKSLSGRQFKGDIKPVYWTCPPSFENLEKLKEWDFTFDKKTLSFWNKLNEKTNIKINSIPGFEKMYPFQLKGVEFLELLNGRALIGDEMGLGKTIQALGYLAYHPELRPAVIICPASLKLNWEKEINTWLGFKEKVHIASGKNPFPMHESLNILIINYDILDSWTAEIETIEPKVLILDEAHYIKNRKMIWDYKTDPKTEKYIINPQTEKKIKIKGSGKYKTARVQAVMELAKQIDHIIPLTGTPIINKPEEFWNILHLLDPTQWNSFWNFGNNYCGKKHNGFGWDFSGSSNPDKLHQAVKRIMIRRTKAEVLPDLPAKVRTVIPLEITNRIEYDNLVSELDKSESPAIQLTRIEALKQLVVEGKIKSCINWISDFLESGEKLVVFCTHKKVINQLMNEFGHIAVKIDGSIKTIDRQASVELFQENPQCKLFIGNIKAAGLGITLTAASSTCFIELGWTPGEHDQAEDRVHRIGQEADSVNAYYLLGQNTIDMEIAELLDEKRKVLDAVLDGKETEDTGLLTELMNRIKGD